MAKVKRETWAEFPTISTRFEKRGSMCFIVARRARLTPHLVGLVAAAAAAGCTAQVDQRGNLPEPDKVAQIRPGSTTRDQVVKILGSPSSTGVFDDKNWYYISRKTSQVSFFDPDVLDQQVYVVNFDGKGVVRSVDRKGMQDGRDIQPAPGATPAPGRELTFLEQVLGNVGRFTKSGTGGTDSGSDSRPGPRPNEPDPAKR